MPVDRLLAIAVQGAQRLHVDARQVEPYPRSGDAQPLLGDADASGLCLTAGGDDKATV